MESSTQPTTLEPIIHTIFEPVTCTWQYIIACPTTLKAAIIDPVLDFNPTTNTISTHTADSFISLIFSNKYTVIHILETHAHADHLTSSYYLQQQLHRHHDHTPPPKISIGKRISTVQETFAQKLNIPSDELEKAFDHTWSDNEIFSIGCLTAKVLYLPGHTPDHIGYKINNNIFTGDSIFNPDVGSARCDFPGGDARTLWKSMEKLLVYPEEVKLYTGHDYPPGSEREERAFTTVKEQREMNKHVKRGTKESEFVGWRKERDGGLGEPRLLNVALQVNVRGGRMPKNGMLMLPVKGEGDVLAVLGGGVGGKL